MCIVGSDSNKWPDERAVARHAAPQRLLEHVDEVAHAVLNRVLLRAVPVHPEHHARTTFEVLPAAVPARPSEAFPLVKALLLSQLLLLLLLLLVSLLPPPQTCFRTTRVRAWCSSVRLQNGSAS